jgi:hypothetical protein
MIPDGSQQSMIIRETRNGVTTEPGLTFYTNTSNPGYVIATRQYTASDNVRIELLNPAGFTAYMIGGGSYESYIFSAGTGAFDLQNYFTIVTATQPPNDVHYSATQETTHTFAPTDNITVKRTLQRPFTQVRWLIHDQPYTTGVTENTDIYNTHVIPASALSCGMDSIVMSVRYSGASADSVYTGYVWIDNPATPLDIDVSGELSLYQGLATTLVASSSTVTTPTFRWYDSQSATANLLHEGESYSPTPIATTTYYISVSNDKVCENEPGNRKEVTVTVTYLILVNPHLRTRVYTLHSFRAKKGTTPTAFGTTPTAFGTTPTAFGTTPTAFGTTPTAFGTTPKAFGTTPMAFGTTPMAQWKERNNLVINKL